MIDRGKVETLTNEAVSGDIDNGVRETSVTQGKAVRLATKSEIEARRELRREAEKRYPEAFSKEKSTARIHGGNAGLREEGGPNGVDLVYMDPVEFQEKFGDEEMVQIGLSLVPKSQLRRELLKKV